MATLSPVSVATNGLPSDNSILTDLCLAQFGQLQTEASADSLNTQDLCSAFSREEARVSAAVARCIPTIAAFIEDLVPRLRNGGRLIYVGARNGARVGFFDCSEQRPVDSDPERFVPADACGTEAILWAKEEAEDSEERGAAALEELKPTANDTVIGISAAGKTAFVLGALKVALARGGVQTAGITNVQPSVIRQLSVDHCMAVLVGPEFLGSAAKQILNMISTCSMVRLGKTYRGLMVDVCVKNRGLQARGRRVLRQVCEGGLMYVADDKGVTSQRAVDVPNNDYGDSLLDMLIAQCGGSIKLACAVAMSGKAPTMAKKQLDSIDWQLDLFIEKTQAHSVGTITTTTATKAKGSYFLAIDGGGSSCKVSIATPTGEVVAQDSSGACNVNSVSIDQLIERIEWATMKAVQQIDPEAPGMPEFVKVWAGLAGLTHSNNRETVARRLENLLRVTRRDGGLILTSDDALLECAIDRYVEGGIAVIAGTGAVATAFRRSSSSLDTNEVKLIGRTGGWGCLLGDPGSAFDIGRRAIQAILTDREQRLGERDEKPTALENAVIGLLGCKGCDLVPCLLHNDSLDQDPKHRIAALSHVVTRLASEKDKQSLSILGDAARSLAQNIRPLAKSQICEPSRSALVLGGGLMQVPIYRELVLENCAPFKKVIVVDDASAFAAEYIARYPS